MCDGCDELDLALEHYGLHLADIQKQIGILKLKKDKAIEKSTQANIDACWWAKYVLIIGTLAIGVIIIGLIFGG